MFTIEMLPAQQGDSLWIEYGDPGHVHRILVDGGTPPTFKGPLRTKIESLEKDERRIELLIITHVDTDHIGGVLKLLDARGLGLFPKDVWFNAWRHIDSGGGEILGPIDGEILSSQLDNSGWPWNAAWDGGAVATAASGSPETRVIAGGMTVTVVSPGPAELLTLRDNWAKVCADAGIVPGTPSDELSRRAKLRGVHIAPEREDLLGDAAPDIDRLAAAAFHEDPSPANGSTISVILEFDGMRCLLAGDAHSAVLVSSIHQLADDADDGRLRLDALKLPHHGSKNNVSQELLQLVRCDQYLCSTNGNIFQHPDRQAIARVIKFGGPNPTIHFNYATEWSRPWASSALQRHHGYGTVYGPETGGLVVDLAGNTKNDPLPTTPKLEQ